MRRLGDFLLVRLVWVLGLLSLAAWCGGCGCETRSYDQVLLLNASVDASLIAPDGGDASAGAISASQDCTPKAAGCVPGGPCVAACGCVLKRDFQQPGALTITKCTLLAGAAPAVEVGYTMTFSGCGD